MSYLTMKKSHAHLYAVHIHPYSNYLCGLFWLLNAAVYYYISVPIFAYTLYWYTLYWHIAYQYLAVAC